MPADVSVESHSDPLSTGLVARPQRAHTVTYIFYQVYCDMSTDGGGYTYYIVKDKRNGVSSAQTIPKFCRDFQPVDIVSAKQVYFSSITYFLN